jgi:hypothetical protein
MATVADPAQGNLESRAGMPPWRTGVREPGLDRANILHPRPITSVAVGPIPSIWMTVVSVPAI